MLTPLSEITDEDAIEVSRVFAYFIDKDHLQDIKDLIREMFLDIDWDGPATKSLLIADFLRSRGYALPWMNYSIQELQDMGWMKLK